MLGQPDSEQNRFKLGVLFLIIGLLLVLWAWGSWVFRISADSSEKANPDAALPFVSPPAIRGSSLAFPPWLLMGEGNSPSDTNEKPEGLRLVALTSMTVVLLMTVFLFGSLAVVIGTRRWRALADRKRAPPTPNADVWAMHKVPDEYVDD